jgi:hypothetical protein
MVYSRGCVVTLLAALQIVAAIYLEGAMAVAAIAVCGACLVDIKITTLVLASVGPVLYWNRTRRTMQSCVALLLIAPVALLLFLARTVSLRNYVSWLAHGSNQGLSFRNFELNAIAPGVLLLPAFVFFRDKDRRIDPVVLAAAVCSVLVAMVTGAKRGSGPWHLAPLIPLLLYVLMQLLPKVGRREMVAALFVACVLLDVKDVRGSISGFLHGPGGMPTLKNTTVANDIRDIVRKNPNKVILMGYAGDRTMEITYQRPLLNALGYPNALSPTTLSDAILAGVPLSPETYDQLRHCRAQLWLLPRGDVPFSATNDYYTELPRLQREIVPEEFQQTFSANFIVSGSSRYFDLWTCKADS